ncbi:hypothetical protein [Paractinoplanes durhamensis]|uniref:Uncharacterized protein n=1 Tax=Paractinoplanes durhamensis TaxID=113563 RepID=A0ABQ3Z8F8_9ACTN|nr:hypothetical protein [Actinoplanes durhamensis]GIE06102.1 hypothetical protein Adu01nite_74520 [Actinoplanes durhamensis]
MSLHFGRRTVVLRPVTPLPVGVLTVAVGGVYFVWLLLRQGRKQ